MEDMLINKYLWTNVVGRETNIGNEELIKMDKEHDLQYAFALDIL